MLPSKCLDVHLKNYRQASDFSYGITDGEGELEDVSSHHHNMLAKLADVCVSVHDTHLD